MAKEVVEALVDGGKATAGPPLGPALGPKGINIGQVISEINRKTADFKGMRVPVKVIIDTSNKTFEITVGTPPASALIKKEVNLEKGSGNPKSELVANLKIEQAIKIAKMKQDSLLGKDNFSRVKEIIGTCQSMGIMVEGKHAKQTIQDINKGAFKDKIEKGKTELTAEELKAIEEEKKRLQKEIEERRAEYEAKAKSIMSSMEGLEKKAIKAKMVEAGIPTQIIEQLMPTEKKVEASPGAEAKPASGAKPEAKAESKPSAKK